MEKAYKDYKLLLTLAVLASTVWTEYVSRIFIGNEQLEIYFEILPADSYFSDITLSCQPSAHMHIKYIQMSDGEVSGSLRDYETSALLQKCEGHSSDCNIYNASYGGMLMREVNVTFQCISSNLIKQMCVEQDTLEIYSHPTYFTTPNFTSNINYDTYPASTKCQCTIASPSQSTFKVELLFLKLQATRYGNCIDYISLNSSETYCRINPQYNPVTRTFNGSRTVEMNFFSDISVQWIGGWLSINSSGSVQVRCLKLSQAQAVTLSGGDVFQKFEQCVAPNFIGILKLECENLGVIDIKEARTILLSGRDCTTPGTNCGEQLEKLLASCEGKASSCSVDFSPYSWSPCITINKIIITFGCIPSRYVSSMCPPTSTTYATRGNPLYLTTPQFTTVGSYSTDANCECKIAVAEAGTSATVSLLYAKLEQSSGSSCSDYVKFVTPDYNGREFCDMNSLSLSINKTYMGNFSGGVKFVSDGFYSDRGAWFKVHPDSNSTNVEVTCAHQIELSTSTQHTTTNHKLPTNLNRYKGSTINVGGLIGGVIGGIVFIIISAAAKTIMCKSFRRQRRANQSPPRQSPHTEQMTVRYTASAPAAGPAADTFDDLPPPFSSMVVTPSTPSDANAKYETEYDLPPSYDDINKYQKGNIC